MGGGGDVRAVEVKAMAVWPAAAMAVAMEAAAALLEAAVRAVEVLMVQVCCVAG